MEKKVFAEGLCFWKLFLFFVIGSLFGTYFEELLYFVKNQSFSSRAGLIYGPFNPLYGFGVVLFLFFLGRKSESRSIVKTFIYAAILGGIMEYIVSFVVEVFFHIRFWDYSSMFLNIHGRTTVLFMVAWGFFATLLLKFIYPYVSKWIEKIPVRVGTICSILFLLFLLFDITLTFTVFLRIRDRNRGVEPQNFIQEFYDRVYPNEFMYKRFPLLEGKI